MFGVSSILAVIPVLSQAATQPPSPSELWNEVQTLRMNNALMVGSKAYQPGSRTIDAYTIDLANKAENDAIRKAGSIQKVTRYPNGALVVKENFNEQRKLTGITAMLKLDGYDPADRNWVMAAYTPAGKVVGYGKIPACIACHTMVTKQDFVFAPPPDQMLPVSVWKGFFPKQDIAPVYAELLRTHADAIVK